ncbi:hypothetical protein lerEdw1_008381 [Lerista edwardsae]|nr:hypothetical protein lerEdw1_008381 [Lerista edwardsae]
MGLGCLLIHSLYCTECRQAMCCICVLLDSKHTGQHCELQKEIQCRKDELQGMNMGLKKKKIDYLDTWRSLHDLVKTKEKVKNETRELIQQKIDAMLRLVQEERDRLLTAVEEKHNQDVQDITEKLQHVKGTVKRIGASERLVEKMQLYASDQEVMDMHSFIRECLEELNGKQLPVVDSQVRMENYTEVKTQLQAFFQRITAEKEAAPAILEEASRQACSVNSPAKRKCVQEEKAIQVATKVIKIEPDDNEGMTSARQASCSWLEQPGTSSASLGTGHATGDDPSWDNWSEEEESSDDEFLDPILLEDMDNKWETKQEEVAMCSISTPKILNQGQVTLVFFDLKIL